VKVCLPPSSHSRKTRRSFTSHIKRQNR
jgi:hypothetical protein